MKNHCAILSFILVKTFILDVKAADCDGVKINNVYYEKEVLIKRLYRPRHLAVDYGTNTLFFSHDTKDNWVSAKINLNTKEYKALDCVPMGFVQTINQDTHEVYIGGTDGLIVYDQDTDETKLLTKQGKFVWFVYFKDILYFATHPDAYVYTFDDGVEAEFEELKGVKINNFVIDSDYDILYFNETGLLYMHQWGTKESIIYPDVSDVRALATDLNQRAFICRSDGIYLLDKSRSVLEKMFDIRDAFGLVFDGESNIIYSDGSKIVRLKPNMFAQC